jgi:hypothetical protein
MNVAAPMAVAKRRSNARVVSEEIRKFRILFIILFSVKIS